ncbi:MAG: response regulator [Helicobacteraceae bacterium]|nr:response regulator [Helicobacteraceae bacterium]
MKIAIVEDDINMRKSLEIAFSDYSEFNINSFKNPKDALKKLDDSYDLVITDINMPGMDGIEFAKTLNGKYEIIMMTGNATLQKAIDSIQLGVKDFLLKPFEIETLVSAIKRSVKVKEVVKKAKSTTSKKASSSSFLATSPALEKLLNMTERASKTDASILLLGESGVGKEVFATHIHKNSPRNSKPFVAINMAAIPDNLIESELFGFEKGAFTDATEAKIGQFEAANGGTLFLDEIGEMPFNVQAKLLRAIQEREIRPLGSKKVVKIDIRIVSATNASLEQKISDGEFREDLFYRLNTIPLSIPPLRDRVEEILDIATISLKQNCEKYSFDQKEFCEDSKAQLLKYSWPGNIRELISVVERATILSDGDLITPESLFLESRGLKPSNEKKTIADMEKDLIIEILENCENNLEDSAKMLGMSQANLKKKITKYNL